MTTAAERFDRWLDKVMEYLGDVAEDAEGSQIANLYHDGLDVRLAFKRELERIAAESARVVANLRNQRALHLEQLSILEDELDKTRAISADQATEISSLEEQVNDYLSGRRDIGH
jgi:hypothetical protein